MSASGARPVLCTFSKTTSPAVGRVSRPSGEVALPRAELDAYRASGDVDRLQRADPPAVGALDGPAVDDLACRPATSRGRPASGSAAAVEQHVRVAAVGVGDPEVVALAVVHGEHEALAVRRPVRVGLVAAGEVVERRGPVGAVGADQRDLEALRRPSCWKRTHGAAVGTLGARPRRGAGSWLAPEHAAGKVVIVTARAAPTTRARARIFGMCMPLEQSSSDSRLTSSRGQESSISSSRPGGGVARRPGGRG